MDIEMSNLFLKTVFKDIDDDAVVYLWRSGDRQTCFFQLSDALVIDKIIHQAAEWTEKQHNVFYSVFPIRQIPEKCRGSAEDAKYLVEFFGDIDIKGKNHKSGKNYPESREEVQKILAGFTPPSILVDTGGGLHGHWLLDVPFKIESKEDYQKAEALTHQFRDALQQQFRQHGREIDSVGDMARVARLPGSMNFKQPDNPRSISIISNDQLTDGAIKRYFLDEIDEATKDLALAFNSKTRLPMVIRDNSFKQPENLDILAKRCAFFKYCEENASALYEPYWHAWINNAALAKNGDAYIHCCSQKDPRYDEEETQQRIERAIAEPRPHTCEYISRELGFPNCPSLHCPVNSPISWAASKNMSSFDALYNVLEADSKVKRDELLSSVDIAEHFLSAKQMNPKWVEEFENVLNLKGISKTKFDAVKKVADERLRSLQMEEHAASLIYWRDKFESVAGFAPVIPSGYLVNEKGAILNPKGMEVISFQFIGVSKRFLLSGKRLRDALIFCNQDGTWSEIIVEPFLLASTSKILELANIGIGVTSLNASYLVRYLHFFKFVNSDGIQTFMATENLGWQRDGSFLPYASSYSLLNCRSADAEQSEYDSVDTWEPKGTLAEWRSHIEPLRSLPGCCITLAGTFASPLLQKLKIRTFLLHVWAPSRGGKTTAQLAAATIWSDPKELQISFNSTAVAMEFKSSFLANLPMFVDERQLAGFNQDWLNNLVYMLGSGQSKARGTTSGRVRKQKHWENLILTTGEVPISADNVPEGVLTRMLEPYFEQIMPTSEAEALYNWGYKDYGSAGKCFIEHVIHDEEQVTKTFTDMKIFVKILLPASGRNLGAYLDYIAILATADYLSSIWVFEVDNELAKQQTEEQVVQWIEALQNAYRTSEAERALNFVFDWLVSHKENFIEIGCTPTRPPRETYGWYDETRVCVVPQVLKDALFRAGFHWDRVKISLAEKGLIISNRTDTSIEYTVVRSLRNIGTKRVVELHTDIFNKYAGCDEETGPKPFTASDEDVIVGINNFDPTVFLK